MNLERIVLGVDGSEGAGHAIEWCLDLARRLDSRILAVHALSPLADWVLTMPPFDAGAWRELATRRFREEWCKPLRESDVPHELLLVDDFPVPGLIRIAEERLADLILVGAHGHSGFRDRVVGSTSLRLVQRAHVPVLVVPPEQAPPPGGLELGRREHDWPAGSP